MKAINKYILRWRFGGGESMGKSDVMGYVVPNFKCKATALPLGKLSRNLCLLQKMLIS